MHQPQSCIKCGRCLEVCPIFLTTLKETFSPRGKWLALNPGEKLSLSEIQKLSSFCLGCEKCASICTQGLNFADYLAQVKHSNPDWKTFILQKTLPVVLSNIGVKSLKKILPSSPPSLSYFYLTPQKKTKFKRVVIFPGCIGQIFPHLETQLKNLLLQLDLELIPRPQWECCGKPFYLAGLLEKDLNCKNINLHLWQKINKPVVITFCSTCFSVLRTLFAEDKILLAEELLTYFSLQKRNEQPFVIHKSCHCNLNLKNIWLEQNIIEVCCGFGGSFCLQHTSLSKQICQDFWSKILPKGSVFTNCLGCLIGLRTQLPKEGGQVFHWLEAISF
ncbi:MAG: (Fe-S)-binding protein [Desulfonauticus sp.]|nr:(Fe-S)-binding protein [Desulfonauticus sp.]